MPADDLVGRALKAFAGLAVKGAIHATADKLTGQITGTPAILEHVARRMHAAESNTPWEGLSRAEQDVWRKRVRTALEAVVGMMAPRFPQIGR